MTQQRNEDTETLPPGVYITLLSFPLAGSLSAVTCHAVISSLPACLSPGVVLHAHDGRDCFVCHQFLGGQKSAWDLIGFSKYCVVVFVRAQMQER